MTEHDCDAHGGMFEVPGDRLRELNQQIATLQAELRAAQERAETAERERDYYKQSRDSWWHVTGGYRQRAEAAEALAAQQAATIARLVPLMNEFIALRDEPTGSEFDAMADYVVRLDDLTERIRAAIATDPPAPLVSDAPDTRDAVIARLQRTVSDLEDALKAVNAHAPKANHETINGIVVNALARSKRVTAPPTPDAERVLRCTCAWAGGYDSLCPYHGDGATDAAADVVHLPSDAERDADFEMQSQIQDAWEDALETQGIQAETAEPVKAWIQAPHCSSHGFVESGHRCNAFDDMPWDRQPKEIDVYLTRPPENGGFTSATDAAGEGDRTPCSSNVNGVSCDLPLRHTGPHEHSYYQESRTVEHWYSPSSDGTPGRTEQPKP